MPVGLEEKVLSTLQIALLVGIIGSQWEHRLGIHLKMAPASVSLTLFPLEGSEVKVRESKVAYMWGITTETDDEFSM